MRSACASPTLPNVPRQPRGELNSPCVLICVGAALLGDSAVVPIVSIVSQGCVERIVVRNDCRFVCGTTSKVHVISPLVGSGGFGSRGLTWMVTVPRQVPARNDVGPEGLVGVDSRPHADKTPAMTSTTVVRGNLLTSSLLPGPQVREARVRR